MHFCSFAVLKNLIFFRKFIVIKVIKLLLLITTFQMIDARNQHKGDNINQQKRFNQAHFHIDEQNNQILKTSGQTIILTIENSYFMIKQQYLTDKNSSLLILLRKNGYPVHLPPMISKTVIQTINSLTKCSPFCQYSSKGHILFYLKVANCSRNQKLILKYKEKAKSSILNIVTNVMELYGIVANKIKKGKGKNAIAVIKNALKTTKSAVQIYTNSIKATSDQEKIQNQQKQKLRHQEKHQEKQIYYEIENIWCSDMNSLTNINKSKKFFLEKGSYNLKYKDFSSVTHSQEHKNIQLLKKELLDTGDEKTTKKLQRQINIIKQINNPSHFVQYYLLSQKNPSMFYMDFLPSNLSFWITNNFITVENSVLFFRQLLSGVQSLHSVGIIHRDLKPENILVDFSSNCNIKIIDFSDSALKFEQYSVQLSNSLGSSLPYSPFQCAYNCEFGVKSQSIDIWSIGVILHELVYRQIPAIYYNNVTREQFREGISKNEFSIQIVRRYRHIGLIGFLQKIVHIILLGCLKMKHTERVSLGSLIKIGEEVEDMMEKFAQNFRKVNNKQK